MTDPHERLMLNLRQLPVASQAPASFVSDSQSAGNDLQGRNKGAVEREILNSFDHIVFEAELIHSK